MIKKLEKSRYYLVEQFLTGDNRYLPLLEEYVLQEKESDIYVDNVKEPKAALVISKANWVYLIGEEDKEFQIEAVGLLAKENKPYFIWFGISSEELMQFSIEIKNFELEDYPRYQFQFKENKFRKLGKCTNEYILAPIDETNVEEAKNFSSSIEDFYGTNEVFLENGFGFLLLAGQKMIGQVISAGISKDGNVEMDIHTAEEYRRKGLGVCMGVAFIERCLQENLVPKWDCMVSNEASKKLALRLGFEIVKEYPVTCLVTKKE